MKFLYEYMNKFLCSKSKGMEMVQVAILIAIAIVIGLVFKERINDFITDIFDELDANEFV